MPPAAGRYQPSTFQLSTKREALTLYTRFLFVRSVHSRAYIVKRSHSQ